MIFYDFWNFARDSYGSKLIIWKKMNRIETEFHLIVVLMSPMTHHDPLESLDSKVGHKSFINADGPCAVDSPTGPGNMLVTGKTIKKENACLYFSL